MKTKNFFSILAAFGLAAAMVLSGGCANRAKDSNRAKEADEAMDSIEAINSKGANCRDTINGHECVDLGLSVMWATCNVGASAPTEYGDYFAWGETKPKEEYTRENSLTFEKKLDSIAGNPKYDAATANWGGTWRLPTEDEIWELCAKCEIRKTTLEGIDGCTVIGPSGDSIFLPATGLYNGTSIDFDRLYGSYWSATPDEDYSGNASYLYLFCDDEFGGLSTNWHSRHIGQSVRPVSGEVHTTPAAKLSKPTGTISGHGYVDLGLSVKWATCNVGAASPSDYGNYYAWGETRTKSNYTRKSSIVHEMDTTTYEYDHRLDATISGNPKYDAARANWGSLWRLPTVDELDELCDECSWKWTTINGRNGYKVTGPNGNSIFLPAAGSREGTSLNYAGEIGRYRSGSPWCGDVGSVNGLTFSTSIIENGDAASLPPTNGHIKARYNSYEDGQPVRPVSGNLPFASVTDSNNSTTSKPTGTINGHGYVDLGLSVKWATCNVGASTPSEDGLFYAWGETWTKLEYIDENSVTTGKELGSIAGDPHFDVARAKWGGTWRLPTEEEISELVGKCTLEWVTLNGHKGCNVTGPNGNSIFLPAAGWHNGTYPGYAGRDGHYWSATPKVSPWEAYDFDFKSDEFVRRSTPRRIGQSVRPVSE